MIEALHVAAVLHPVFFDTALLMIGVMMGLCGAETARSIWQRQ